MTNEMDRVSRLTSGNVDRIRYFFARRASTTFRIAFATFLALVALSSSAPGALSVGPVITPVNTTLQIADLSLVTSSLRGDNDNNFNFLVNRAEDLTLLEHHEDFNFRYDVEPNWIIAWPDEKSMGQEIIGMVEYPTDVIRFNYSCEWRKPDMGSDDDTNATTWLVDGQIWELWSEPRPDIPYRGGEPHFFVHEGTFLVLVQGFSPYIVILTWSQTVSWRLWFLGPMTPFRLIPMRASAPSSI